MTDRGIYETEKQLFESLFEGLQAKDPAARQKRLQELQSLLAKEAPGEQLEWLLTALEGGAEVLEEAQPLPEAVASPPVVAKSPRGAAMELLAPSPLPPGLPLDQILCGDCLEGLRQLPDASIQLVITSPPYFQQRDYGGEGLGNEDYLEEDLRRLLEIFRECVRVVAEEGSIVFNLGDKYQESSLLLVPYRFAIAATETGLVKLVNNVTWVKQNPTPRQFQRRLVSSTEPFFHFVKSSRYYYDLAAFMAEEPPSRKTIGASSQLGKRYFELIAQSDLPEESKQKARQALTQVIQEVKSGDITGFRMKIRGIHSEPFGGQEGGRKIQLEKNGFTIIRILGNRLKRDVMETPVETLKGCRHPAIYPARIVEEFLRLLTRPGDVVCDPFMGSGSTAVACLRQKRRYIGFEVHPDYCAEAEARITEVEREAIYSESPWEDHAPIQM